MITLAVDLLCFLSSSSPHTKAIGDKDGGEEGAEAVATDDVSAGTAKPATATSKFGKGLSKFFNKAMTVLLYIAVPQSENVFDPDE